MHKFQVQLTDQSKMRLDHFLVKQLKINKTQAQKLIAQNLILVNKQIKTKNGWWLEDGDAVEILSGSNESPTFSETSVTPYEVDLDVVYEDDDILVINKLSGLLVHPTHHNEVNTLVNVLAHYFQKNAKVQPLIRNGIVHRLDKDTSGLILVAKTAKALENLLADFANQKIIKKYQAIILGHLPAKHLKINLPIGRSNDNTIKMRINSPKDLKEAVTEVYELEQLHEHALVECQLHTGRTHQIRVHLAYLQHPVLNDYLYGHEINGNTFGQYLHAYFLEFQHPITKKNMQLQAKWPKEFQTKYDEL